MTERDSDIWHLSRCFMQIYHTPLRREFYVLNVVVKSLSIGTKHFEGTVIVNKANCE